MVYFFQAGVLFRIQNSKFWPILAGFGQFWLFCHEFTYFTTCILPKKHRYRIAWSKVRPVLDMLKHRSMCLGTISRLRMVWLLTIAFGHFGNYTAFQSLWSRCAACKLNSCAAWHDTWPRVNEKKSNKKVSFLTSYHYHGDMFDTWKLKRKKKIKVFLVSNENGNRKEGRKILL